MKLINLVGLKFGRLLVLERSDSRKHRIPEWRCVCDCGKEGNYVGASLRYGGTKSCGCLKRELIGNVNKKHGMAKSHFWIKWWAMKQRCDDKNSSTYYKYGARGISICDKWKSFEGFLEDMYGGYQESVNRNGKKNTTLDRIDPLGNYNKENCRWATHKEQANNKRNTNLLTYRGQKRTLVEWVEKLGLNYDAVQQRLKYRKWNVKDSFEIPIGKRRQSR